MNHFDSLDAGRRLATQFIPFLFALCFHEFAHGWVAKKRGDNTAELMGRLTLNPMAHADMVGTFFLPIMAILFSWPFAFGWAKPVPVNARNLKNVRTDMFWVALAGPLSNVLLAFVSAFIFALNREFFQNSTYFNAVNTLVIHFIMTNMVLACFNMIPLHPLDGAKVLARFLPTSINYRLERNEMASSMILMLLMFTGMFRYLAVPVMLISEKFMQVAVITVSVISGGGL